MYWTYWTKCDCGQIVVKWFEPENKYELFDAEKQRKSSKNRSFWNFCGGDKRDRTADLLNAIQALSQLSYTPKFRPLLQTAFAL